MRTLQALQYTLAATSLAFLAACGGGGGGGGSADTQSGSFINSPTKGVRYTASPSGLSGVTDENGTYTYKAGDTVTFKLDIGASTVTLGSTSNPSASTSVLSLVVPNGGSPLAVAQVLETLDKSAVTGKMDVSGINIPSGNSVVSAINSAISSSGVSSTDIASIATGVQTVLTATNSGSLKYGTAGVTTTTAVSNLAKNSANQALLDSSIPAIPYDGRTTVIDLQNRPAFAVWRTFECNSGKCEYVSNSRFWIVRSNLTYEIRSPFDSKQEYKTSGTYTLSNGNRYGDWVNGEASGSFSMTSADASSYIIRYSQMGVAQKGFITGAVLNNLTVNDIKSRSFTIFKGCPDGVNDVTLTFDANAVAAANCGSHLNGTKWAAGFMNNMLQSVDAAGKRRYFGITKISNNLGAGNLPSGSYIDVVEVYPTGDTAETYQSLHRFSTARVN
jgi:hypothetical protein